MSELIATLLLLMITTAGSMFLAYIVQGSGIGSLDQNPRSSTYPSYSIRLTGYDTRDGNDLSGIASLDNLFDKKICTSDCQIAPDDIPANGGTEFVVLQIKNVSPKNIHIQQIQINGVLHSWDQQTGGKSFDASANDLTGKYPLDGKFSIIPTTTLSQKSDNKLHDDEEVRLVVKLSKDITPNISLSKPVQVLVDFGGTRATEFLIMSGDTK
jgi:hypothetical protein